MKFGALLRNSAAELPELHQLFVSYKQLKKRLKRLPERQELVRQRARVAGGELPDVDVRDVRQQEEAFVQVLDQDVQQFNRYTQRCNITLSKCMCCMLLQSQNSPYSCSSLQSVPGQGRRQCDSPQQLGG